MNNDQNKWPQYSKQLAVMIDAGLSIESALRTLNEKGVGERAVKQNKSSLALRRVIGLVTRGQSLSKSLKQAKCISKSDYTILNIAESAGKLPRGLQAIYDRRSNWLARIRTLQAGLLLPKVLLVLGAFAGPLIRTLGQEQSLLDASFSVFGTLVIAWGVIKASVCLVKVDSLVWLSFLWPVSPVRFHWSTYSLAYENVFYRLLAWQISAGVAPDAALKACGSLFTSQSFKQSVMSASKGVTCGESMPDALINSGLVLSQPLKRVLLTSLDVGSWDSAVVNHLDVQKHHLMLKADNFFKWLPRLYYLLALLALTKFMMV